MSSLKEAINIIKKRKKGYYLVLLIIFLLLFFQFFLAGQYLYKTDKEKAEELMEIIANTKKIKFIVNTFKEGNYFLATILIFLNNFFIGVLSMYSGIIFFVPLFILLSNALSIGIIFGIGSLMPPPTTIYHIIVTIVVAILEISSMLLVTYEGIRIGMSLINPKIFKKKKRKDALKQNLKEGTKILFLVMLILMIAAIIETIGMVLLGSRFISW